MQLGQHFTDIKGSKYMLVHSLASKYARFVVLVRLMYWTPPPPHQTIGPTPLKSDDLFFREPRDIGPPLFKNPGHARPVMAAVCYHYSHGQIRVDTFIFYYILSINPSLYCLYYYININL